MKVRARILIAGLALVFAAVAAAGPDVVLDALLQRPSQSRGVVVVPDRFLRSWDPITVFLPTVRGPEAGGPAPDVSEWIQLDPEWPGAWTWLDGRTLQFRPAEPYRPLDVMMVQVSGAPTTRLATLMTPPSTSVPSNGARDLGPVEEIALTFPSPMDPDALARMVTIELRALPGLQDAPVQRLAAGDFEVKVLERSRPSDPGRYALILNHPIPLGNRATVRFGLSLDDSEEAVSKVVFDTAQPFRVASLGCRGQAVPIGPDGVEFAADAPLQCGRGAQVRVGFTATPAPIGPVQGRNLVRFEPAVDNLKWGVSGRNLFVNGDFKADVPYRVSVAPASILDESGRPLELDGEGVVWMQFPRQTPFLKFNQGHGIAERRGPQRIPVQGRGHGKADLRIYRVDPLNRNFWPFPNTPVTVDESTRPPGPR